MGTTVWLGLVLWGIMGVGEAGLMQQSSLAIALWCCLFGLPCLYLQCRHILDALVEESLHLVLLSLNTGQHCSSNQLFNEPTELSLLGSLTQSLCCYLPHIMHCPLASCSAQHVICLTLIMVRAGRRNTFALAGGCSLVVLAIAPFGTFARVSLALLTTWTVVFWKACLLSSRGRNHSTAHSIR